MAMVFVPSNPAYIVEVGNVPEKNSEKVTINSGQKEEFELDKNQYIIELFVEEGDIRVRTDGNPCTEYTGQPIGEGYSNSWNAKNISVHAITDAIITVVYR